MAGGDQKKGGKKGRKIGRQKRNQCDAGQKARTTANKLKRIQREEDKKKGKRR